MLILHPVIQNISFTKSKTFYKIQNVSFTKSKLSVLHKQNQKEHAQMSQGNKQQHLGFCNTDNLYFVKLTFWIL